MRARAGRRQRLLQRRGATLVLVSITIFILIGFAALAVDVARLTHFKSELKGIADAAAMSAALDLAAAQTQTNATTNVSTLVSRNGIGNAGTATVVEVTPVTWSFTTNAVTATPLWNAANAVRVVTRYPVNWIMAQLLGQGTGRTLQDTSIAAFGMRSSHDCLRPIVFPYSAIRSALSLAQLADTTSLTAANIFSLRTASTSVTYTVLDTVNVAASTRFGWANTKQGSTGTTSDMVSALSSCVSGTLGAGSSLLGRPTFGDSSAIQSASVSLCGGSANCTAGTRILVPIYVSGTNTTGLTTTTTTSTPAPNQTVNLSVSKNCYSSSNNTSYSNKCNSFVATLQTASTSSPVFITTNGVTYACRSGPTYAGLGAGTSNNKGPWYLLFQYTNCVTTTTTTTGSGRGAATYVIKYIATFVWTARTNTTLTGYFTTVNLPPAGTNTWDDLPGPITSAVLVR